MITFTTQRIVESTEDNFLDLSFYKGDRIDWFEHKNKDKLEKIIIKKGLCYSCYIVHKEKSIRDYLVEIDVYEHTNYGENELRSMTIYPRKQSYDITNIKDIKKIIDKYKNCNYISLL